ncbi:MAG: aminotransferase class V-fold PLP-dependent enzyme [Bacteroidetes bacterium]|nr:aminotransferase class V-fold PLP-dependent enzyme [Bacteroidota bacterium]
MKEDLTVFNKLVDQLLKAEKEDPVAPYIEADKLFETLDLNLEEEPMSEEAFGESLRQLVLNTPRTATKMFFNQLFGGRQPKAVLGDLLAVMLNNSMYTYKVAGPQVGVEKAILNQICDMIGYGRKGDGTFAPGGSMSNLMAMLMARDARGEKIRKKGINESMTMYTSKISHYSIPKNAAFIGIGRDQVRYIETDDQGVMLPEALENQIRKDIDDGFVPFMVNATAGTTVLGSFDPIEQLSVVCKKYDIWLHVDGAYCGAVIFSDKYKHLVKGLEKSDSFSVNAHKMLGTPLSCSIIVTRHRQALYDSFSNDASYLYQTDGDDFNLGKISLQCGRRNDALKFWTLWKSEGTIGLRRMVDQEFHLADVAREYVRSHPDYTLYSFDDSISVCFNYKDLPPKELCTMLYENSEIMVGFGSFRGQEFVRLVTINAGNKKEDVINFFKAIESFVEVEIE